MRHGVQRGADRLVGRVSQGGSGSLRVPAAPCDNVGRRLDGRLSSHSNLSGLSELHSSRAYGPVAAMVGEHGGMTSTNPPTELHSTAEAVLQALAGPGARLRDDQWTAIEALVAHRRRALVVQRTGWGKSAVYFVATALLRAAGAGPTVIVSPLLALMRNQLLMAERAGVRAMTIHSQNTEE